MPPHNFIRCAITGKMRNCVVIWGGKITQIQRNSSPLLTFISDCAKMCQAVASKAAFSGSLNLNQMGMTLRKHTTMVMKKGSCGL